LSYYYKNVSVFLVFLPYFSYLFYYRVAPDEVLWEQSNLMCFENLVYEFNDLRTVYRTNIKVM